MWWGPTTEFFAYIDRGAAHLRSAAGFWSTKPVREEGRVERGELSNALRQASRGTGSTRRRLHVLLASSLCRFLLLENTRQLRSDAEVLAVAAGPLRERLGLDPAEWTSTVDPAWDRTALVCAMRSTLLEEFRAAAAAAGARLVSVRPWVGELLRARDGQARNLRWLGVIESDAVSLVSDHGGSTHVQTLLLNDGADPLAALRYLAQSAGVPAQSLPIVQLDPIARDHTPETARTDFTDRATFGSLPS